MPTPAPRLPVYHSPRIGAPFGSDPMSGAPFSVVVESLVSNILKKGNDHTTRSRRAAVGTSCRLRMIPQQRTLAITLLQLMHHCWRSRCRAAAKRRLIASQRRDGRRRCQRSAAEWVVPRPTAWSRRGDDRDVEMWRSWKEKTLRRSMWRCKLRSARGGPELPKCQRHCWRRRCKGRSVAERKGRRNRRRLLSIAALHLRCSRSASDGGCHCC